MPANAGIQFLAKDWVPAFAGTSGQSDPSIAFLNFCSAALA